jgi:hypothetical protein
VKWCRYVAGWLLLAIPAIAWNDPRPIREMRCPAPASGNTVITRRIAYAADKLFLFQLERAAQPKLRARNKESSFQLWIYSFARDSGSPFPPANYLAFSELDELYGLALDLLLVRLDRRVAVLSPDAKIIFVRNLAELKDREAHVSIRVSPDRRSFYIFSRNHRSDPLRVEKFDSTSQTRIHAVKLQGYPEPITASNDAFVFRMRNAQAGAFELWIQNHSDREPRVLHRFKREECVPTASFVAEDRIAILSCDQLRFLDLTGSKQSSQDIGNPGVLQNALVAAGGDRVAFHVLDTEPMRYLFGPAVGTVTGQRIMVWDQPSQSFILRISLGKEHGREPNFAFSSAGDQVAILESDTIKIYLVNHD